MFRKERFLPQETKFSRAWNIVKGDGPTHEEIENFQKRERIKAELRDGLLALSAAVLPFRYILLPHSVLNDRPVETIPYDQARQKVIEKASEILRKDNR